MSSTDAAAEKMRGTAEWMRQPADERILEILDEEGNMTPRAVSKEGDVPRVNVTRDYAGDRLRVLTRYGLVERIGRGLYRITDTGRAYLAGDVDPTSLEPDDS